MQGTDGDLQRMDRDLSRAAKGLRNAKSVLIISHIDADGITAGSIAKLTLERLGIEHRVLFQTKITEETVHIIDKAPEEYVWVCDLGSGYLSEFNRSNLVITDHHVPDPKWRKNQTVLDSFVSVDHLNPHTYGIDGSIEVSGAGMTYLLSKKMDPKNTDLAYLAIIGAIGDFQDSNYSQLVGINRTILQDAIDAGDMVIEHDLRLFGRETRPIIQFFQYCNEPRLEGLTDNPNGCMDMLEFLNIPIKKNNEWRRWNDLDQDEKDRVIDNVLELSQIQTSDDLDINVWQADERNINTSIQNLVKNALRSNPDWLIIAESRGGEMLEILNSTMTGHPVITTIHAQSVEGMPNRIARMVMMNDKRSDYQEVLQDVYDNYPIHIYLKRKIKNKKVYRFIDTIAMFDKKGKIHRIYEHSEGRHNYHPIPKSFLSLFEDIEDEVFISTFGGGKNETL